MNPDTTKCHVKYACILGAVILGLFVKPACAQWHKINKNDVVPEIHKDDLKIHKDDLHKVIPKISRHEAEKSVNTAWQQIHDGTVHLGHQTSSNFKSVSDYIDARMKSFCELMGPDESCVEDGVGVGVNDQGETRTYNPKSGESYPIGQGGEGGAVAVLPQIVIMAPSATMESEFKWKDASLNVAGNPFDLWPVSYWRLPANAQSDADIKARWDALKQSYDAARQAQASGRVRPFVALPSEALGSITAGETIKLAYDATSNAADVWDVMMGTYRFSWLGVAAEVLSPEKIGPEPRVVMGLYPEEVATLKAASDYYGSLPAEIRISHEAELAKKKGDSSLTPAPAPLP